MPLTVNEKSSTPKATATDNNHRAQTTTKPRKISNTPLSVENSTQLNKQLLPQLSKNLYKTLKTYASASGKYERLERFFPDTNFSDKHVSKKSNHLVFQDINQLTIKLNGLLATCGKDSSSLYQALRNFIQENNLGELKENGPLSFIFISNNQSKKNTSELNQDLHQKLLSYAKEEKHRDRLENCFPNINFSTKKSTGKSAPILFNNTDQLSKVLNTLLATCKNDSSALYQLVKKFVKSNNLGQVEEKELPRFTFYLSEEIKNKSLVSELKSTHPENTQLISSVKQKYTPANDSSYTDTEINTGKPNASPAEVDAKGPSAPPPDNTIFENTDRDKEKIEDTSSNPFGDEDGIDMEAECNLIKNAAINLATNGIDNSVTTISNNAPEEAHKNHRHSETPPPHYQQVADNDSNNTNATGPSTAQDASNTNIHRQALHVDNESIAPSTSKANHENIKELPSSAAIYITTDNPQDYASNIRKVGSKNAQNVYINFEKISEELFKDKHAISSLPGLYREIKNVLNDNKNNKTEIQNLSNYLKSSGLNKVIDIKKERHGNEILKKWHVNFAEGFILKTMESSSSISEDQEVIDARNNILSELNKYIKTDSSHAKKLQETLKHTQAGNLLAINNDKVIWVDENTWPKNTDDFDFLINCFLVRHGNHKFEANSKSSLIRNLNDAYKGLPQTTYGDMLMQSSDKKNAETLEKKLSKLNKNEIYFVKNILTYIQKDLKTNNIDKTIENLTLYHLYKSNIEAKEDDRIEKINDIQVSTNTNRTIFERIMNWISHPINSMTKSSKDDIKEFTTNLNLLNEHSSSSIQENKKEVNKILESKLRYTMETIKKALIETAPGKENSESYQIIEKKLIASFEKQKFILISDCLIKADAIMYEKTRNAIATLNLEQTDKSGKTLNDWFTTFSAALDAYKIFQQNLKRNLDTQFDLTEMKKEVDLDRTIYEKMENHFYKNYTSASKLVSEVLLKNIKVMNFDAELNAQMNSIARDDTLAKAEKAEKIKNILLQYKEKLEPAINLLKSHDDVAAQHLRKAQGELVKKTLDEMKNKCPQPLSRWGRIKEVFFGEGRKASIRDRIVKSLVSVRTAVVSTVSLLGGTALTLGILSAAGVGILAPFVVPLMIPVITAGLIVGGAVILTGVAGYGLYNASSRYKTVRTNNIRVQKAREDLEEEVKTMSEYLKVA